MAVNFAERIQKRASERPEARFARQVQLKRRQERTDIPGPELARDFAQAVTGQPNLEGPGLTFAERAKLSLLGDTPEEKQAAFEQTFPEGEYVPVPNTDITLIRRNRQEPFQVADPSIGQAFQEGRLMAETVRDLGDLAGDLPEIVGETALFLAGKGKGRQAVEVGRGAFQASRGVLSDLMRLFAGGAGGSQAQQAVQTAAGTQRQTGEEQLQQSVGEGAISIVGGTFGDIIGRGINVAKGGGIVRRTPEGIEAQRAAERIGSEGSLPVSAVTDNPIIRLAARQSGSLTTKIGRDLRKFNTELLENVTKKTKPAERARLAKRGRAVLKEQNNEILSTANKVLGNPKATIDEVGPVLQKAVDNWWNVQSKNHVDKLYDVARGIETPDFDVSALKDRAQQIVSRPTAATREGGEVAAGEVDPAIERVAQKIQDIDPEQPVDVEFLRGLRQEIFDASTPGPGGERLLDARARSLRAAIRETMQNPTNTNAEFRQAWREADNAALDRFQTRELLSVSQLLNTDRPAEAVRQMVKPGNFEGLAELSRAMKPSQFKQLGRAWTAELLSDPRNANKTLDNFRPNTRRLLISEPEEKAIRKYSQEFNQLEDTKLRAALDQQATTQRQIREIISNPDSRGINEFRKLVRQRGGMNSPFGKSVRAAIMDEIVNRARTTTSRGAEVINQGQLRSVLDEFKDSGVMRLLPNEDAFFLNDVEKVRSVLDTAADAGTALRAAQTTSGLLELSGAAFGELIESIGVGRVLTSEAGKRFLTGTAQGKPIDLSTLRLMGSIVSTVTNDVEEEE